MKQFSLSDKTNILGTGRNILKKARETIKDNMDKSNLTDKFKTSSEKLKEVKTRIKKNFKLS